ncbi:DUF2716 domain-containing protein [Kitasatospora camelliae]|uniref:DUF2716 domain-containing protein n=1 Tax=Kitasatospora camelliae TaxID=3156397 RepID=A0AAU8K4E8_9ACTN
MPTPTDRRHPAGAGHPRPIASLTRFGTFGHPWERSLCVLGAGLLDLVEESVHRVLPRVLRRNGTPAG